MINANLQTYKQPPKQVEANAAAGLQQDADHVGAEHRAHAAEHQRQTHRHGSVDKDRELELLELQIVYWLRSELYYIQPSKNCGLPTFKIYQHHTYSVISTL